MNRYYLAVDIGASSGRHILGWMENGKMNLREIYRFSNGMEMVDGTLCWNLVGLFEEIKAGMREAIYGDCECQLILPDLADMEEMLK